MTSEFKASDHSRDGSHVLLLRAAIAESTSCHFNLHERIIMSKDAVACFGSSLIEVLDRVAGKRLGGVDRVPHIPLRLLNLLRHVIAQVNHGTAVRNLISGVDCVTVGRLFNGVETFFRLSHHAQFDLRFFWRLDGLNRSVKGS